MENCNSQNINEEDIALIRKAIKTIFYKCDVFMHEGENEVQYKMILGGLGDSLTVTKYLELTDLEKRVLHKAFRYATMEFRQNPPRPNEYSEVELIAKVYISYIECFKSFDSISTEMRSGCYIATAVYGDYNAPEVIVLRSFRDKYLATKNWGRQFIRVYYKHSPKYAESLKKATITNRIVNKILDLIVFIIQKRF